MVTTINIESEYCGANSLDGAVVKAFEDIGSNRRSDNFADFHDKIVNGELKVVIHVHELAGYKPDFYSTFMVR